MKKIIAIIFCLMLTFSLFACSSGQGNNSSGGENISSTEQGGGSSTETSEPATPKITVTINGSEMSVTLDGNYSGSDFSDVKLVAHAYTFSTLKTDLRDVNASLQDVQLVDDKTVLTFEIRERIENGRALSYAPSAGTEQEKQTIITQAKNIITWQLDNGGWDKDLSAHKADVFKGTTDLQKITKGWTKNGVALGTIDNDATYSEMRILAEAYNYEQNEEIKASFMKGMGFLKLLQTEKGGFTQVYPKRGNYSDCVTYNDDAMAAVLRMLYDIKVQKFPFTSLIIDETTRQTAADMLDKGVEYTLNAQIVSNGEYSGWCSQHDPVTYEPQKGRDYEPVSISSSESFNIIKVLLTQQDNAAAIERAEQAMAYFEKVALQNTNYRNTVEPYFYEEQGKTIWYRFYEINTNRGVFGDRDKSIHYELGEISEERRLGYSWAGDYGSKLLKVYKEYGFYEDLVYLSVPTEKQGNGVSITAGSRIKIA